MKTFMVILNFFFIYLCWIAIRFVNESNSTFSRTTSPKNKLADCLVCLQLERSKNNPKLLTSFFQAEHPYCVKMSSGFYAEKVSFATSR